MMAADRQMVEGAIGNTNLFKMAGSEKLTTLFVGAAGVTLSGYGRLFLGTGGDDRVVGSTASPNLINDVTAVIDAASSAIVIDTGTNTIVNAGKLGCVGSGALTIDSALANDGVL
jgi:hypothetical protein